MARRFTEDHRKKLSEAHRGKRLTEDHKRKIGEALKLAENEGKFTKGQTPWNKGNKAYCKCKCNICGKIFYKRNCEIKRSKNNFCSIDCSSKRVNNPGLVYRWYDGRKTYNGYVALLRPKHPFANFAGYVYEHRLVMEKHLGRYLKPEETIHHNNGDKTDNRIGNLKLFINLSEHTKFHWSKNEFRERIKKAKANSKKFKQETQLA